MPCTLPLAQEKRRTHLSRPSPWGNSNTLNQHATISSTHHALSHYGTAKMMKWTFSPNRMGQLF